MFFPQTVLRLVDTLYTVWGLFPGLCFRRCFAKPPNSCLDYLRGLESDDHELEEEISAQATRQARDPVVV